jgi:hypothetical protein
VTEAEAEWWRHPLARGARAGGYYCLLVAALALSSRILGLKTVHVAWGGGALALLVAFLSLLERSDGFKTVTRAGVSILAALVVAGAFAFVALVIMVNILLMLGWGL